MQEMVNIVAGGITLIYDCSMNLDIKDYFNMNI